MAPKARRVVDFLLANPKEAALLTIGEVAERLGVSKAQLVRVARQLNFAGYSALKQGLQESLLEEINPVAMLNRASRESELSLVERIFRTEITNLKETCANLSPEKMADFCRLVKNSHTIHCAGWGISSITAESLYSRLRELGLKGFLMRHDCLTLIEQVRALGQNDLLIIFELPSYSLRITEMAEAARGQGVTVITVTDSLAAPVCKSANLSFFVSDASLTFGSSILSSFFLVHLLTSALSVSMGEQARIALEQQAQCLNDKREYHPVFELHYS